MVAPVRHLATPEIPGMVANLPWRPAGSGAAATCVDLRGWLPTSVNQGTDPLCTAVVIAGLADYMAGRCHGFRRRASVLFNYCTSRMLAGEPHRRGSFLSFALSAWFRYGLVTERTWPHRTDLVDALPPEPVFDAALSWRERGFARLDSDELSGSQYVTALRTALAAELPVSLDIPLHLDLARSFRSGLLGPPDPEARIIGRHAVLLCGYDDAADMFLVQNCWGPSWGDGGFGYLPYDLVRTGQARNSYTVIPSCSAGSTESLGCEEEGCS